MVSDHCIPDGSPVSQHVARCEQGLAELAIQPLAQTMHEHDCEGGFDVLIGFDWVACSVCTEDIF